MPFVISKAAAAAAVAATTSTVPIPTPVTVHPTLTPITMYEPYCQLVPHTRHNFFTTETVLVQQCVNIPKLVYMK